MATTMPRVAAFVAKGDKIPTDDVTTSDLSEEEKLKLANDKAEADSAS